MIKNFLLALGVFAVGIVSIASADDLPSGPGQGWNTTICTGTAQVINQGKRTYLKKVILSSATTATTGNYAAAYTTAPRVTEGADGSLFGGVLFGNTAQMVIEMVYRSTTTVASPGDVLNNGWSAGDCASCWIEFPQGIYHRQATQSTGGAEKAQYIWK